MNMNIMNESAGEARAKIFCSLVIKEGKITRGVIIQRMHISAQTFAREYLDYLQIYPQIKYNRETRIFTYSP